jgi:glycosidase
LHMRALPGGYCPLKRAVKALRRTVVLVIRAYQYLISKFEFDGFRIDTVKHVDPNAVETFGNAIREFAQTLGKRNFFTFGEVLDSEEVINRFVDDTAQKQRDSISMPPSTTFCSSKSQTS